MYYLFFCLFSVVPYYSVPTIECDSVEINHFYDELGRITFDQLIFREPKEFDDRQRDIVLTWRLIRDSRIDDPIARKLWEDDPKNKGLPYVPRFSPTYHLDTVNKIILYKDSNGDILRVKFKYIAYESWTQYDPELADREYNDKKNYIRPIISHKFIQEEK